MTDPIATLEKIIESEHHHIEVLEAEIGKNPAVESVFRALQEDCRALIKRFKLAIHEIG